MRLAGAGAVREHEQDADARRRIGLIEHGGVRQARRRPARERPAGSSQ